MTLKLIENWTAINDIKNTLKDRKEFLITINNKYFTLITENQLFHGMNLFHDTNFEIMNTYDGNMDFADGDDFAFSVRNLMIYPGGVIGVWKSYSVDFFGADLDAVLETNSEIVIAGGDGTSTPDTSSFVLFAQSFIGEGITLRGLGRCAFYTGYAQNKSDLKHITLVKSVFMNLDIFFEELGAEIPTERVFFANFPMHTFYSKLILKINNSMEFI